MSLRIVQVKAIYKSNIDIDFLPIDSGGRGALSGVRTNLFQRPPRADSRVPDQAISQV